MTGVRAPTAHQRPRENCGLPISSAGSLSPPSHSSCRLIRRWPVSTRTWRDVTYLSSTMLAGRRSKKPFHGSTDPSESSRIPSTGLKHLVSNKIRLSVHDVYVDRNPCVLIVPVLTLQQVVEWQGGGYQAIVMAGAIDEQIVQHTKNQSVSLEPITLQEVNGGICMSLEDKKIPHEIANENHVKLPRELLLRVVNGMAYSLIHRLAQTSQFEKGGQELENLNNLLRDSANTRQTALFTPVPKRTRPTRNLFNSLRFRATGARRGTPHPIRSFLPSARRLRGRGATGRNNCQRRSMAMTKVKTSCPC